MPAIVEFPTVVQDLLTPLWVFDPPAARQHSAPL
jgi:hypothetical protein